ncbi:MAG: hypothetical protein ACOX63_02835 [Christensenellales bacterium]
MTLSFAGDILNSSPGEGNTSRRTHPKRGSAQAESAAGTGRQGYRPGRRRERAIQRTMSGSGNMGGTADAKHSSLRG